MSKSANVENSHLRLVKRPFPCSSRAVKEFDFDFDSVPTMELAEKDFLQSYESKISKESSFDSLLCEISDINQKIQYYSTELEFNLE